MNAQIKSAALEVARELFSCEEAAASAALPIARAMAALLQPQPILPQPTGPGQWWVKVDGEVWMLADVEMGWYRGVACMVHTVCGCEPPWPCADEHQWSGPLLPPDAVQPRYGSVSGVAAAEEQPETLADEVDRLT